MSQTPTGFPPEHIVRYYLLKPQNIVTSPVSLNMIQQLKVMFLMVMLRVREMVQSIYCSSREPAFSSQQAAHNRLQRLWKQKDRI